MLINCDHCGYTITPIEVHGHLQCSNCKTNIEPCCQGGK